VDLVYPSRRRSLPRRRLVPEPFAAKVPEVTLWFWIIKILTTAGGEATSDSLRVLGNVKGGGIEVGLFLLGVVLQFRTRRYTAIPYWFLAYAIAVFGTGVSDFLHLDVGIPYSGTTALWAVILAAIFLVWYASERTLSIHSIVTTRRELFYWATVFATFALGTALGDFTATALGLGYLASGILFAVVILVPAVAWRWFGMNAVAAFWFAYVVTRPLGASFADYFSKPHSLSGMNLGDAQTAAVITAAMVVLVGYLAVVRTDIQPSPDGGAAGDRRLLASSAGSVTGRAEPRDRPIPGTVTPAAPERRHLGGWPQAAPTVGRPGEPHLGAAAYDEQPGEPASEATWRLSERAQGRLGSLTHQGASGDPKLVYFDRTCAGCGYRQLTRLHDGVYLCDTCGGTRTAGTSGFER
jgi:uncharacterized membrane-anchored protein